MKMKIFDQKMKMTAKACLILCAISSQSVADEGSVSPAKNTGVKDGASVVTYEAGSPVKAQAPAKPGMKNRVLRADQWETARTGDYVLSLSAVNDTVDAWLKDRHSTIEIQFPGGEEGEFWVQELYDWLVALGIPSASIVKTPGSGAVDVIRLGLVH